MAVCSGTKRDGSPCATVVPPDLRYCYHHDPDRAEERKANATHAATTKHSKIDAEIRGVRHTVRDLLDLTLSDDLHPNVKKRLVPIAQILQSYCRLAELELSAGGRPRTSKPGEYGLPEDTSEKAEGWAQREAEKEKIMEGIAGFNRNPRAALEAMK